MAQGEFTKEEAQRIREVVDEMFKGVPKSRQLGFIGHLNDVLLFVSAAEKQMEKTKAKARGPKRRHMGEIVGPTALQRPEKPGTLTPRMQSMVRAFPSRSLQWFGTMFLAQWARERSNAAAATLLNRLFERGLVYKDPDSYGYTMWRLTEGGHRWLRQRRV